MYKLKDGFIVRKIGDQIMAVPVGTRTSDMHGMIVLSESAELLWGALEKGATIDELVQSLSSQSLKSRGLSIDRLSALWRRNLRTAQCMGEAS